MAVLRCLNIIDKHFSIVFLIIYIKTLFFIILIEFDLFFLANYILPISLKKKINNSIKD